MNLEEYLERLHKLAENDKRRNAERKVPKKPSDDSDKSGGQRTNMSGMSGWLG